MSNFVEVLTKLISRPSTIWRLLWLLFCLVVLCYTGPETLQKIIPYVLAGIPDSPTAPKLPVDKGQSDGNRGIFANWILPALSWSATIAAVTAVYLR